MTDSTEVTNRPETSAQLADLIESLTVFDHDGGEDGYQQSADAMWKAALAAFNYTARKLGCTGFQASWSALRFYGEAMHIDGPFMILEAHDALFPQYDFRSKVDRFLADSRHWLTEQARSQLDEYAAEPTRTYTDDDGNERTYETAHPDVVAHWRALVGDQQLPTGPRA